MSFSPPHPATELPDENLPAAAVAALQHLVARLALPAPVNVVGLTGAARGHVASRLLAKGLGPLVAVAADEEAADLLEKDLRFFLGSSTERDDAPSVLRLPSSETLPYEEIALDRELEMERLRALFLLVQRGLSKAGPRSMALVLSLPALLRKVLPRAEMERAAELVGKGATIDRDALAARLVTLGYANVPLVEDPGTFAVRGGIVDVFSPVYQQPARLELFGDEIEGLRLFDPETQRTSAEIEELYVCPAREILLSAATQEAGIAAARAAGDQVNRPSKKLRELTDTISEGIHAVGVEALLPGFYGGALSTVGDYLPADCLFFIDDPAAVERTASALWEKLPREFGAAQGRGELALPPEQHFAQLPALIEGRRQVRAHKLFLGVARHEAADETGPLRMSFGETATLRQAILQHHGETGALAPLSQRLQDWRDTGTASVLACHTSGQAEQLKRLLLDRNLMVKLHSEPFREAPAPLYDPAVHAHLFVGEVSQGFVDGAARLALVADEEIFGPRSARKVKSRRAEQPFVAAFRELNEGDLVVHVDHGIARYGGLRRMSIRGVDGDFLLLHYDGADKLYLPVAKLNQIQKFTGAAQEHVRLDKLGSQGWVRTKQKVKEHLLKMAAELLDIYAARKAHPGHAFSPADSYFRQFEADFPFEETPDQARAIADVLSDMTSAKPMDRLVCGDVGFGKTEVALRAAFKAVLDKKQVVVLVPTTVLASQHYRTFQERFKDYPVRVEMLSRLRDPKETRAILAEAAAGKIDVLVGTHKLLSRELAFKDLGLVVIDEEQRFGVTHKEKLKKLRKVVDVLTLTATPIPRTLHMSLAGIRDLSIIASPPEDRRAIRTFVVKFEPEVIREAIEREVGRGGQVFVVHNRVRSIAAMAKFLEELCPKVRFAVAHGQMEEHRLDRAMSDFIERKYDALICTSIIEAGLDIPSVNTMIVNRADMFGLAQLYQLRGRVGRSKERAYAYLLIPSRRPVTKDAQLRLEALQQFTELGSGFRIASHDLEIRGAGNLLGPDQSGQIAAVGFDLYAQMLDEAVHELRGEPLREEVDPEVTLPVSALLPEDYLPDVHQRLLFYKKLAQARSDDEVFEIRGELRDRCGEPPIEVDHLTELTSLRIAMRKLRLRGLETGPGRLVVSLGPEAALDPDKLAAQVLRHHGAWRLTPEMKLICRLEGDPKGPDLLQAARKLIDEVSRVA
jgi:transcription-repair coupling factor (superfamily II helicase)